MTSDGANALALGVALGLAAMGPVLPSWDASPARGTIVTLDAPAAPVDTLRDARDRIVATGAYARIVSMNVVADHLLPQLVEPGRLVGVHTTSKTRHPDQWRFVDVTGMDGGQSLERLVALRPDLVIVSNFVDEAFVTRLSEHGIVVFDLGPMRGVQSTLGDIRALGALLEVGERARRLEDRFVRELSALYDAIDDEAKPEGLYLSVYGDAFFGGTTGSSYADLLRAGGIIDLAAAHGYRDWPRYSPEQLVELDPALIITQEGMGGMICAHGLLRELAACQEGGRIAELPGAYHTDPGLGLVPAAQILQRLVHPTRTGASDADPRR